MIRLDYANVRSFLSDDEISRLRARAAESHETLLAGSGAGNEYLGWRRLLADPNDKLLDDLVETADHIRRRADVFLCIGIGGSYLGAKAVIQALSPYFGASRPFVATSPRSSHEDDARDARGEGEPPEIIFAGHHMSGAYVRELLHHLDGKSVFVNVISKSGTTLEPALAFRFVRQWLESRFDDADQRIIVTTDPSEGALNILQRERGYKKFIIPPSVGGRFSVLTPVGLLPIAVAGVDIGSLLDGAASAFARYGAAGHTEAGSNAAVDYAALRYGLLQKGYAVELLAVFEASLIGFAQWWQQLFGESEGKQGTGLFPAIAQYSTDLHSFGQYVQEGRRSLIETFIMLDEDGGAVSVPPAEGNLDGLDYLTGMSLSLINRAAYEGTAKAHQDGGVPNLTIWLNRLSADAIGECIYLFEHAVSVGGYMLGLNPFDQPGVEAYKKEMFRRLGRPSTTR